MHLLLNVQNYKMRSLDLNWKPQNKITPTFSEKKEYIYKCVLIT